MANERPPLIERVRRFAMPQGAVESSGTWLRQHGEMRLAPDRPYYPSMRSSRSTTVASTSAGQRRWAASGKFPLFTDPSP